VMTCLGSLIVAALFAQAPAGRGPTGEVVDDQGNPVADAQVVFYSPPTVYGNGEPVEAQTRSDSAGNFSLKAPPLKRIFVNGVNFLAHRPGLAITAHPFARRPYHLVLEKPLPRTVLVEGPDGKPIAGARIMPRLLSIFGKAPADVPASLAEPLAVSTGPGGKATLNYLAARDRMLAVRVSADAIGTQDVLLVQQSRGGSEPSVITIKLKPTTHVAGRVVDHDGQPVVDHDVEVWSRGGDGRLLPNTVEFKKGSLRTRSDGSFQTPDNLMVGSTYRVAIREEGKDSIFSDWTTMTDKPSDLPLFVLRPLCAIRGQVVDRQGKPMAGVEVFQSGDGPEPTSARTDAGGRFSLGGFRQGPVFLFARGDGFRFEGRLIRPAESDVTVELTRVSERPARAMKMLPDPIPFEESRAMARRLVEPLWATAAAEGDDNDKYSVLSRLVSVDPARVLERLASVKFKLPGRKNQLQRELVLALVQTDFEEASAVAESIEDPATRAWALVHLSDTLPVKERDRKLALLDRALLQARTATEQGDRLLRMGEIAERWYELGEVDKARRLCAEGLQVGKQLTDKTDFRRGLFAASVARIDMPSALAIGKELNKGGIWKVIALQLIDDNPAEAERLWNLTKGMGGNASANPTLAWKLATADPAAARRLIEGFSSTKWNPYDFLFIALGANARNEAAALDAFQIGVKGIDRLLQENPEGYQIRAGSFLPIVERIDPALVPEVFWLDLSSRLPTGNPRMFSAGPFSQLVTHLAWYDRDVAAALFEPVRARIDQPRGDHPANWASKFVAWSLFDPRAAVACLETLPIDPKLPNNAIHARLAVAESLAQTHEQRWRKSWDDWDIILGGLKRDF
jgi:Carboxypeptidase regulatory-like domain